MKTIIKTAVIFVGAGAAFLLAAQFLGTSGSAAKFIYTAAPALAWLLKLWLPALAGLLLYLVFSGLAGKKFLPFLTGIHIEGSPKDSSLNALRLSFSFIMGVLLVISAFAFIRVDVHTGYACESSDSTTACTVKPGSKKIIFLPAIALPGAAVSSKTLRGDGNMEYFVGTTPPIGGDKSAWMAFLTLLFIAVSRISLLVFRKRAVALR